MNTIQNNTLIAQFMGFVIDGEYCDTTPSIEEPANALPMIEFMFNSWDELMPVILKCKESQIFGSQGLIDNIDKRLLQCDLSATYGNVVSFVEFYNTKMKSDFEFETINYKGKEYKCRVVSDANGNKLTIAPYLLEVMLDLDNCAEDIALDNTIFYYADAEEMLFSNQELTELIKS